MPDSMITCPNCKQNIPLTSAIEGPIAERLRREYESAARVKEAVLAEREKTLLAQRAELEKAKETQDLELARRMDAERQKIKLEAHKALEEEFRRKETEKDQKMIALQQEVNAAQRRAETLAEKERDLAGEKAKLEEVRRSIDEQVLQKVKSERARIVAEESQRAKELQAAEVSELQSQVKTQKEQLHEAQKHEMELRKQRLELEEKQRTFELEKIRAMDEERGKIRAEAVKAADDAHRLKEKEQEVQMAAMRRQIDELKQKAEQGSQQLQGEVLELELEGLLRAAFPHDQIVAVAKGVHGGDVVHKVMTSQLRHCGTILWESKRTKTWSDGWIDKLKMDQRAAKADVAVIVSMAMPGDFKHMGCIKGVWVASRECMMGMVLALRDGLLKMADAKQAEEGKHEKMEVLYAYFSGHEFRQRVEAIKEAFVTMREELEAEKRAMTKIWAKREKQLERVMVSTAGMHGDLSGIIGGAMPQIAGFELKTLAGGGENEE